MTEFLVIMVLGLAVIGAATVLGPRLGIASPLVLVGIGVAASFLPVFAAVEIDPEWILAGILPPLLYSAAVSMPSMNFRREFAAIGGLSVVLVVATSLILGLFFMLVLPDLGFAWGVALGAVISPTDAVATSIVKQTSVSKRVVAILDGESLLNDATALVLLRTAIAATGAATGLLSDEPHEGFSFWGALGTFGYSVLVAVAIGWFVGWLNLLVRKRITDPTVNTVLSFGVPFVASVPAEILESSGLVAAVVAGLITGIRAPRMLPPQSRLSDGQNWRAIELVLEGAVFLTMGLQIKSVVATVHRDHGGIPIAVLVAVGALLLTVIVRTLYVVPLLRLLRARSRGSEQLTERIQGMQQQMSTPEGREQTKEDFVARGRRNTTERDLERFARRLTRGLADIEYFRKAPLGWREQLAVVWAGMRGAVTVAAVQTLPEETPQRSVLIFIAFAVALLSLLLQGGTIGPLLRRIAPDAEGEQAEVPEERRRIMELLRDSGQSVPEPPEASMRTMAGFEAAKSWRLQTLAAQRSALLDARDNGTFDADLLDGELRNLDAAQIAIELRATTAGA